MVDIGEIYETNNSFQRKLDNNQKSANSAIIRDYAFTYGKIRTSLDKLSKQITEKKQAGETIPPSWLYEQNRLENVLTVISSEIDKFSRNAFQQITKQQAEMISLAQAHNQSLMNQSLGNQTDIDAGVTQSFVHFSSASIHQLVGFAGNGSPLDTLFKDLGNGTAQNVKDLFVNNLAHGWNPRKLARDMKRELGVPLSRALTISRTESLRAYREASHQNYKANDDVLSGWIWQAAIENTRPRPCAACFAMHGTFHKIEERLHAHPNCRCTQLPVTKSWAELGIEGIEEDRPQITTGKEIFDNLDDKAKQEVLGKEAFRQYQAGKVDLLDFRHLRENKQWGPMITQAGINQALENAKQKNKEWFVLFKEEQLPEVKTQKEEIVKKSDYDLAIDDLKDEISRFKAKGNSVTHDDVIAVGANVKFVLDEIDLREAGIMQKYRDQKYELDLQIGKHEVERAEVEKAIEDASKEYDRLTMKLFNDKDAGRIADEELDRGLAEGKKAMDLAHAELLKRRTELISNIIKLDAKIAAIEKPETKKQVERIREAISTVRQMGGEVKIQKGKHNTYKQYFDEALKNFPTDWIESSNNMLSPLANSTGIAFEKVAGRAHYNNYYGVINVGYDPASVSTLTHEFTHRIEYSRPQIRDLEEQFYRYRTAGDMIQKLNTFDPSYDPSEIARFDKFKHPYAGKDYGGRAWELATMGMEDLFYLKYNFDNEYRNFILGLLAAM